MCVSECVCVCVCVCMCQSVCVCVKVTARRSTEPWINELDFNQIQHTG